MGRKLGAGFAPTPLGRAERGPHLTQSRLGRGLTPYQVTSWSMQPFGRNRYGPKVGGRLCPFGGGELGPHPTQCGQGRGLPARQASSWSVQPFGHSARTSQTLGQDNGPIEWGEPFYKRSLKTRVDRSKRSVRRMTCFYARSCFLGSHWLYRS